MKNFNFGFQFQVLCAENTGDNMGESCADIDGFSKPGKSIAEKAAAELLKEQEEIFKTKDIEFYSQSVNAWYLTALEKDKAIFVFSMAGIGFMIALLTAKVIDNYLTLVLLCLATVSFLISTITIIYIF